MNTDAEIETLVQQFQETVRTSRRIKVINRRLDGENTTAKITLDRLQNGVEENIKSTNMAKNNLESDTSQ